MKEQLKIIVISVFTLSLLISCDDFIYTRPYVPEQTSDESGETGFTRPPSNAVLFTPIHIGEMPYEGLPYGDYKADYLPYVPVIPDTAAEQTIRGTYYHLPWPCIETDTGHVLMLISESDVLKDYLEENSNFPVDVADVNVKIELDVNGYKWARLTDEINVTPIILAEETFVGKKFRKWFETPWWTMDEPDLPRGFGLSVVFNQDDPDISRKLHEIRDGGIQSESWYYITFKGRRKIVKPDYSSLYKDRTYYYAITQIESYEYVHMYNKLSN